MVTLNTGKWNAHWRISDTSINGKNHCNLPVDNPFWVVDLRNCIPESCNQISSLKTLNLTTILNHRSTQTSRYPNWDTKLGSHERASANQSFAKVGNHHRAVWLRHCFYLQSTLFRDNKSQHQWPLWCQREERLGLMICETYCDQFLFGRRARRLLIANQSLFPIQTQLQSGFIWHHIFPQILHDQFIFGSNIFNGPR